MCFEQNLRGKWIYSLFNLELSLIWSMLSDRTTCVMLPVISTTRHVFFSVNKPDFSSSRSQKPSSVNEVKKQSIKLNRNWATSNENHRVTVDSFKTINIWTLVCKAFLLCVSYKVTKFLRFSLWLRMIMLFLSSGFWKFCIFIMDSFRGKRVEMKWIWILSITIKSQSLWWLIFWAFYYWIIWTINFDFLGIFRFSWLVLPSVAARAPSKSSQFSWIIIQWYCLSGQQ